MANKPVEAAPTPGGIDFSTWSYNTLPERTGNIGWQPDLQDLIYTAINHVEGDYEDADENCAEQVIERLVLALKASLTEQDRLRAQAEQLRELLVQRTADICKAQPDPTVRRVNPSLLSALAEMAEAHWAMAENERERLEATALEMLVAWQRDPPPAIEALS
jgi:hypothetical protein